MVFITPLKQNKLLFTVLGIVIFLGTGITITKLTVHDLIDTTTDRSCIDLALNQPIKKFSLKGLILATGKTQIIKATAFSGEAKAYTIFRMPLDFFNISIFCDLAATNESVVRVPNQTKNLAATTTKIPPLREEKVSVALSGETVANWETCKNEEYGYEFKYPNKWYLYRYVVEENQETHPIIEVSSCQGKFMVISEKPTIKGGWFPTNIHIQIIDNFDSPEEYLESINTKLFPITTTQNYSHNKIKILQYERQNLQQAVFFYNKKMVNIRIDMRNIENQNEFFNTIVSTFKFIN